MASPSNFYTHGTPAQFEQVISLYPEALKIKAQEKKNKKSEELIKLDAWYQEELPKKIKSRGKDAHLTHEELVQCMKWKLSRGQWRPRLQDLVQINTPRAVEDTTKKALRQVLKKGSAGLMSAIQNLGKLKGVGPATASAVLAAAAPETAPFMADECLMSIPHIDGIDYTANEYLKYVQHVNTLVDRLNTESDSTAWNAHRVELALWAYYIISQQQPSLLKGFPGVEVNGNGVAPKAANGVEKDSEDSSGPIVAAEESSDATNDSVATSGIVSQSEETNSRELPFNSHEDTNDSAAVMEGPNPKKRKTDDQPEEAAA